MIIGIVGSEQAKFTSETEAKAKEEIRKLINQNFVTGVSSGHCHLGGIDIWTEEIGQESGKQLYIFPPKEYSWNNGYKPRNEKIAKASSIVYCITVKELPKGYNGMRFDYCYHCNTNEHVKSGGCWTVKYAIKIGKTGKIIVV